MVGRFAPHHFDDFCQGWAAHFQTGLALEGLRYNPPGGGLGVVTAVIWLTIKKQTPMKAFLTQTASHQSCSTGTEWQLVAGSAATTCDLRRDRRLLMATRGC